jgi:hypothetical protein
MNYANSWLSKLNQLGEQLMISWLNQVKLREQDASQQAEQGDSWQNKMPACRTRWQLSEQDSSWQNKMPAGRTRCQLAEHMMPAGRTRCQLAEQNASWQNKMPAGRTR